MAAGVYDKFVDGNEYFSDEETDEIKEERRQYQEELRRYLAQPHRQLTDADRRAESYRVWRTAVPYAHNLYDPKWEWMLSQLNK